MNSEKRPGEPSPSRIVALDATAESELPRQVLEEICLRAGSLRGLGSTCGRSSMWLWRQLRRNKRLDFAKIFEVLRHLEIPPRFYFQEMADRAPVYSLEWLLGCLRSSLPDPDPPPNLPVGSVEQLLDWTAERLEQRQLAQAADGLLAGQKILARASRPRLTGRLWLQVAELAFQLGQLHPAERAAREALDAFRILRSPGSQEALLQLSRIRRHLGKLDAARLAAIAALRLRNDDPEARSRGWFELAKIATRRGKEQQALGLLERAQRQASRAPDQRGHLHWWQGVLLARSERPAAQFAPLLSKALQAFKAGPDPEFLFLAAADLVELLASTDPSRALRVVRRLNSSLPRLEPAAQDLWLDLSALLIRGPRPAALRGNLVKLRGLLARYPEDTPPPVARLPSVPFRQRRC